MGASSQPVLILAVLAASGALTAALIFLLRPLMVRYALARPNARSSHREPTPQGGGIAVVASVVLMAGAGLALGWTHGLPGWRTPMLLGTTVVLAVLGALDDVRPLPVMPRLILQFACAIALVAALPEGASPLQSYGVPHLLERVVLVVGLVWFVNLTNFMDGIDLMTVVEVVPIAVTLALAAGLGLLPPMAGLLALALAGAMLGFAPFNWHVARLFLGDVGSLAIGGLVGWMLIVLASAGHLAAAIILPMYYLADTMLTLFRRWRNGERLSQAHRKHFYQLATQRGYSVPQVTTNVLGLNLALVGLAWISMRTTSMLVSSVALGLAGTITGLVLWRFQRGRL